MARICSHSAARPRGSSPVVGSSRKMAGGSAMSAATRSSRRRSPPESVSAGRVGVLGHAEAFDAASSTRALRSAAGQVVEAPEQVEVLADRELLVDRRALAGQADGATHDVGLAGHVEARHRGTPAIDGQQRREQLDGGGLAGAVGSEQTRGWSPPTRKRSGRPRQPSRRRSCEPVGDDHRHQLWVHVLWLT